MNMHDLMAVIGYCVSFAGAVTLVFFLIGLCMDYCWRKVWDIDAFMRVCDVARANGIKLKRRKE
ncbi:MAG TPA: hypothetical protein VJ654_00660 [Noviherbaspirillum sp.]|nr:hypothetical protein [Noviherbaspirillum sp.]